MKNRKIIYACHDLSPLYKPVLTSLQELGFGVKFFDYYKSSKLVRSFGLICRFPLVEKIVNREKINKLINLDLIKLVKKFKPDYLLVSKGLHLTPETINKIKSLGVITINWFPDFWEFLPWMKKNAPVYDYFFDPDLLVINELNKMGIKAYYLPYATYPDKELKNPKKIHGIVFIGQYTKRREKFLKPLVKLGLKIWGYKDWLESSLSSCYQGLLPSLEDVFQKYRESKIIINVVTGENNIPVKTVNLRVFEVAGVGGFLLNWYKKPIDDFYKNDKEIVNFETAQEAFAKAKYYLEHDEEREKIALAGWKRTKKEHTWEQRFKKMFEIAS